MPPFLHYFIRRLLSLVFTLLIVTMILYGFVLLTPPESRVTIYLPSNIRPGLTEEQVQNLIDKYIDIYHLRDPFPIQYSLWLAKLLRGDWGYSPLMDDNVLPSILRRTPVTAELTFYSLLLFIPLGIISGVIAGSRSGKASDFRFRLAAFIATSLPTFVLAIILMAVFYVFLRWFPPERLSIANSVFVKSANFHSYTGFMTIDGFLNKRADISLDAARHLVLPVITLSLLHWATLGRVTRATMIEEVEKDYFMAAKARGVKEKGLIWKHAFRNVLSPALTSTALSAAALFTGVFVVEVLFNLKGVSSLVVIGARGVPDAPLILGFGVYSVVVVLLLMFFLDIIQAFIDPRL